MKPSGVRAANSEGLTLTMCAFALGDKSECESRQSRHTSLPAFFSCVLNKPMLASSACAGAVLRET